MIEVVNLVKDYGNFRAVDHVHFRVGKGEILGFLGPNGAGKSTTMKMLTGFLPPTAGTAFIGGNDIRENPLAAKSLIGYLPESGPLYQEMTCWEFLNFICNIRDMARSDIPKALDRIMDICQLESVRHKPIEVLSKGYRQRIGMAQAVLHDPPCLILDEPTDGLDPNQKRTVRRLIRHMAQEKVIIISTHILEEVEALCNRIIIIDRGKIRIDESPETLRGRHPCYNAVRLVFREKETAQEARKTLERLDEVREVSIDTATLRIVPENKRDLRKELSETVRENGWVVDSIERESVSLEEIFWQLTHTDQSDNA